MNQLILPIENTFCPDPGWDELITRESQKDYFKALSHFLQEERNRHTVYPEDKNQFKAFELTPLKEVKVVLLGQDPYHGPGQAHGLAFSVPEGIPLPPSLRNIFKEISGDLQIEMNENGNLERWAKQGVLLLNTTLTVRAGVAGSHQNQGWETFTSQVIKTLSEQCNDLVFLLWGKPASSKKKLIDQSRHHILESVHPSPLSAYRGFFGCRHFSITNRILTEKGLSPVNWA